MWRYGLRLLAWASSLQATVMGCGAAPADAAPGVIRGRVTDLAGEPLAELEVEAAGLLTRTDARGRFTLELDRAGEVRVAVVSPDYSSAELPVRVEQGETSQVELAVKPHRALKLADAVRGGRLEAADGFALELPERALEDAEGKLAQGEVEVRYALIRHPDEVGAAPGSMQEGSGEGLDGYGMAELRFYQGDKRLSLREEVHMELPLHDAHGLEEGKQVPLYQLGERDLRWKTAAATGTVQANKVVLRTKSDAWLGAAQKTPVLGCVTGSVSLAKSSGKRAAHTSVRAARARGLSLVLAETRGDGSFCLPVSPDDDWRVSTYYDDGSDSYGVEVEVRSSDSAGMCGGDGCKDVGEVVLDKLAQWAAR